jgi:hypothetical protein
VLAGKAAGARGAEEEPEPLATLIFNAEVAAVVAGESGILAVLASPFLSVLLGFSSCFVLPETGEGAGGCS